MAEKFLYYLGAGASAAVLPTVKPTYRKDGKVDNPGFNKTVRDFASTLTNIKTYRSTRQETFLVNLANECNALIDKSENFATIDTYAKYLHLTNKDEFRKLKNTLSNFFTLYQLWSDLFDSRYLSWLTSILSDMTFPQNIKVLTWNYDFQIQLATEYFSEYHIAKKNEATKNVTSIVPYWPAVGWSGQPQHTSNDISWMHLNGLAGTFYNKQTERYDNLLLHKNELLPKSDFELLQQCGDASVFNFAWEKGTYQDWLIFTAQQMVQNTTIVVVIGYSFPFFNRDVDKRVFEQLKYGPLRKIYFQDPYLDGSFLRAQFNLPDHVEIIHRKEVDSFYIPFEL